MVRKPIAIKVQTVRVNSRTSNSQVARRQPINYGWGLQVQKTVKPKRKPAERRSSGRTTSRNSGPRGLNFAEPPDADSHVGWCGRGESAAAPLMPIGSLIAKRKSLFDSNMLRDRPCSCPLLSKDAFH